MSFCGQDELHTCSINTLSRWHPTVCFLPVTSTDLKPNSWDQGRWYREIKPQPDELYIRGLPSPA